MHHPYVTEYTEYIAPDGAIYRFDGDDRFLISENGLGMPPINYILSHGPFQHGETALDFRLGSRTIQLLHLRKSNRRIDYWNSRADLLDLIRPNRQLLNSFAPGILRKRLPYGCVREVKVLIQAGPGYEAQGEDVGYSQYSFIEMLRFVANDPTLYDPAGHTLTWSLSANTNLIFPVTFPFSFANNIIQSSLSPVYVGTWHTYPTITITGPITGPRVNNVTLAVEIFLNYAIAAGETVTITLDYAHKTVTNQNGVNLLGLVADPSGLANFRIAPAPEASGGINLIQVDGYNTAVGTTAVSLTYQDRYIGI